MRVDANGNLVGHGPEPSNRGIDTGVRNGDLYVGMPVWVWWWARWWRGKIRYINTQNERVTVTFDWRPSVRVPGYPTRLIRLLDWED